MKDLTEIAQVAGDVEAAGAKADRERAKADLDEAEAQVGRFKALPIRARSLQPS